MTYTSFNTVVEDVQTGTYTGFRFNRGWTEKPVRGWGTHQPMETWCAYENGVNVMQVTYAVSPCSYALDIESVVLNLRSQFLREWMNEIKTMVATDGRVRPIRAVFRTIPQPWDVNRFNRDCEMLFREFGFKEIKSNEWGWVWLEYQPDGWYTSHPAEVEYEELRKQDPSLESIEEIFFFANEGEEGYAEKIVGIMLRYCENEQFAVSGDEDKWVENTKEIFKEWRVSNIRQFMSESLYFRNFYKGGVHVCMCTL